MTDAEDDRSRALAQPGRASARPKPPPPTFEDPPPTRAAVGRVPVARVPASEVRSPAPPPPPRAPGAAPRAAGAAPRERREAPERPPTANPNTAPVLTKLPAPFTVRLSQFFWVMSLLAGAISVVYLFVIREDEVKLIADFARSVVEGRSDEVYATAADILFWAVFGTALTLLLIQIVLLVSFSNRKPNVRWWQLATVAGQILLFLLSFEFFASGEYGPALRQMLLAQWALALLALLISTFQGALRWTARRHDIRRAGGGEGGEF